MVFQMLESGQSVEQFGDAIGWDVKVLLSQPKALWSFNVEGLYDLCKPIHLGWVKALPESVLAGS